VTDHWFEPIADHLGAAYLRYSFTKGTGQEVEHVVAALGLGPGQRVLDVGCGTGALTGELVRRVGSEGVSALDPSESLSAAVRERYPGVDVEHGSAERLPFADGHFDATLAQLVVHFMSDPGAGVVEMRRVTRSDGVVAACVWDHAGGTGPLATFWQAVHDVDPHARDESHLPGAREGHLVELCRVAGLTTTEASTLTVRVSFQSFADWWRPFTLGVGPAGDYVSHLSPAQRDELEARCALLLPSGPFDVTASAWCVTAHA
jgi:SAM-dependent methyltransferase